MDCGSTILIFLAFIQATCGQTVILTGPSAVEQGRDTVYTCTGGIAQNVFIWEDLSEGGLNIFVNGAPNTDPTEYPKYVNFGVSENEDTSTLTISNTQIEDEGEYRCGKGPGSEDSAELKVEVESARNVSPDSPIKSNIDDIFEATCEAEGGRPEETITWMLGDGTIPCDDPGTVGPTPAPGLSSKTSVCTFQATSVNNGQTLKCVISGHNVSDLNGEVTATLDTHSEPSAGILTVGFQSPDPSLTVSCDIADANQPIPSIMNYYIYSNDTLIHQSSTGDNHVEVPDTEFDLYTNFTCVAGNYLGNTTSQATRYDPYSTTTPTPTTTAEPITEGTTTYSSGETTTQPSTPDYIGVSVTDPTVDPSPAGLSGGAYAGIAIGVIACIVIIVVIVLFLLKPECCPCFASGTPPPSNKPSGRAVGSSNGSGSEKDVESPLNGVKDVTAEEKLPQAAPRGHGSIQHTNDNPDQAMYAMVDKKPARGGGGGDVPDTRGSGPGQNEPQGMLYADLDLSHKAGHTDKHVPKNENDVVVYSSILV